MKRTIVPLFVAMLLFSGCLADDCSKKFSSTGIVLMSGGADNQTYTSNIYHEDINNDGEPEIFVTESVLGSLQILEKCSTGDCEITDFSYGLGEPVRVKPADLNSDGNLDLVVADIGSTFPSTELVGRVVVLFGTNNSSFYEDSNAVVILDNVGRVTCAEVSDVDGDGDLDVVVCEFGHIEGSVSWLEQNQNGTFVRHVLDERPGAIHAYPHDADGDGDIDIASVISQTHEVVMLYENVGGEFVNHTLFKAGIDYFGMTGLFIEDFDGDSDIDLGFTNGAQWDGDTPQGVDLRDLHGFRILQNEGNLSYVLHNVTNVFGAYTVTSFDYDNDGDIDVFLGTHQSVSAYPNVEPQSLFLLRQTTELDFEKIEIPTQYSQFMTIYEGYDGVGDLLVGTYFNSGDSATRISSIVINFEC